MVKKKKNNGRTQGTGSIIKRRGRFYLRCTIDGKRLEKLLLNDDGEACTNPCDPNPCLGVENSTGECMKEGDAYMCACEYGFEYFAR